jgi:phosphoribosylanthranilate isomerase
MRQGPGVRVKFCGLTRVEDVQAAASLGVDAIGLVFYPPSPRAITVGQARALVAALPPGPTRVGLFVDPDPGEVESVLAELPLDMLQFHGNEPAGRCQGHGLPYLKAIHLRPGVNLAREASTFLDAFGLLLDTYHPGVPGGTGEVADWSRISSLAGRRIVLAGGLHAGNVGRAVLRLSPYAVDVSSGIEQSPGVKSLGRMSAFIDEVRHATASGATGGG